MKTIKLTFLFLLFAFAVVAQVNLGIYPLATASGTDEYTATVTPGPQEYNEGQRFNIKFENANTGSSTININDLGAVLLTKSGGTALEEGDISAGEIKLIVYDGTSMQVVGGGGGASSVSFGSGLSESNGIVSLGGTITGTTTLDIGQFGGDRLYINAGSITGGNGMRFQIVGDLFDGGTALWRTTGSTSSKWADIRLALGEVHLLGPDFRFSINAENGTAVFSDSRTVKKGIQYSAAGYVTDLRSLTDKEYVDTKLPKASTASTGTTIAFDVPRTYGYATAATGNITLNSTGLVEGITQLLIHNDEDEPTFGEEFKVLSGEYVTSVDNYILMHAVKSDLILVTISQEQ